MSAHPWPGVNAPVDVQSEQDPILAPFSRWMAQFRAISPVHLDPETHKGMVNPNHTIFSHLANE